MIWKITDCDSGKPFSVTVEDLFFFARINAGEPFRKGDTIRAVIHVTQRRTRDGGLSTPREIAEIVNRERTTSNAPQELPLEDPHDAELPRARNGGEAPLYADRRFLCRVLWRARTGQAGAWIRVTPRCAWGVPLR